jgi:TatD DNase family protein
MLFDTHCHLDNPAFAGRLPQLLFEAEKAGVTGLLVPGIAPEGWEAIAEIARSYPKVHPAFGIHPLHAGRCDDASLSRLADLAQSAVAVGEIGLDYFVAVPKELQMRAFRAQLAVAVEAGVPVLIHCRRAFGDLLPVLREGGGGGPDRGGDACLLGKPRDRP